MDYYVNILAHNEENTIGGCIRSVLKQCLNKNDNIFIKVISNGCTDRTDDVVRDWASKNDRVSLFSIEDGGKVNALRTFLGSTHYASIQDRNEIAFFMDADVQLNNTGTLKQLAGKLLSDEALYAVSASCIPESVYNSKKDFVSCLFRVQAKLHQEFRPNIFRGMLYCIRTDILHNLVFPKNLLADDIFLEICLDGHFATDYDAPITYALHKGIKREVRRNFMHCLGVLQSYLFLKEKKICRTDRTTSKECYRARYFNKLDIARSIIKKMDINALFFMLIYNVYYKINGLRARRLLNRFGTEGMDYRSFWKTRQ